MVSNLLFCFLQAAFFVSQEQFMQHSRFSFKHGQPANLEPCRFLPSACILTATNLKDIRMSLILGNKILNKETAKTTRKSSLYFIPREQRFDPWRLVLRRLERYPALRKEIRRRSPPLDLPQSDFYLKYENRPLYS